MNRLGLAALLLVAFGVPLCGEEKMQVRTFEVDPEWLLLRKDEVVSSSSIPADPFVPLPAPPADPFAAPVDPATRPVFPAGEVGMPASSRRILESDGGVRFPPGATSYVDPVTCLLHVRNTPKNLEMVEAVLDFAYFEYFKTLAWDLVIVEGPAERIREVNEKSSSSSSTAAEFEKLLAAANLPGSGISIVGEAYLEGKPGAKSSHEAVIEDASPSLDSALKFDAGSRFDLGSQAHARGLRFEVEPTIGMDGITIEFHYLIELQTGAPIRRLTSVGDPATGANAELPVSEFSSAKFSSKSVITVGNTSLVGITKPEGSDEVPGRLWAAFLTVQSRTQDGKPFVSYFKAPPAALKPPPGMSAVVLSPPQGLIASMIWPRPPQSFLSWLESHGIVAAGAVAEQHGDDFHLINTPENIERIAQLVHQHLQRQERHINVTLQTIEAPAELVRELVREAMKKSDHGDIFARLESAAAAGQARFVDTTFFADKGQSRIRQSSAADHVYLSEYAAAADGRPKLTLAERQVGAIAKIETSLGPGGRQIEASIEFELHPAAPKERRIRIVDSGTGKQLDLPRLDFQKFMTKTDLSLADGRTQILSVSRPLEVEHDGKLWVTFIRPDVVHQIGPTDPVVESSIAATDASKAMETRSFRVDPDFLFSGSTGTAQEILAGAGIDFPEGAFATFAPIGLLHVQNTRSNLDLVEIHVSEFCCLLPARTIALTAEVIEAPGHVLRSVIAKAATRSDHASLLAELLAAIQDGTVKHLGIVRSESRPGESAHSVSGRETRPLTGISSDPKGALVQDNQTRNSGFSVEWEGSIAPSGTVLELLIGSEFHFAPPTVNKDYVVDHHGHRLDLPLTTFHAFRTAMGISVPDGSTQLLAVWKPTTSGPADILQAIFITARIQRGGE